MELKVFAHYIIRARCRDEGLIGAFIEVGIILLTF
jgi:hypothetical protein